MDYDRLLGLFVSFFVGTCAPFIISAFIKAYSKNEMETKSKQNNSDSSSQFNNDDDKL